MGWIDLFLNLTSTYVRINEKKAETQEREFRKFHAFGPMSKIFFSERTLRGERICRKILRCLMLLTRYYRGNN